MTTIDLRALVHTLRESINKLGGFSPEQVRKAASLSEDALQQAVLSVLIKAPMTGHEILLAIAEVSVAGKFAKASDLYPLLERMADLGLVKAEVKKDRKKYSLTELGKDAAKERPAEESAESETKANPWSVPSWVDLNGALPKASKRLAGVALEVAQHGSKDQQEQAAAALDEARRKLHQILASD